MTKFPPTLAWVSKVPSETLPTDVGALALRMPNGGGAVCEGTQQSTAVAAVDAGASAAQVLAGNVALAATGATEIPMEALTVHADACASAATLP